MKIVKLMILGVLFSSTGLLVAKRNPQLHKQLFVAFHEEWVWPKLLNALKKNYPRQPEKIIEFLGTQDEQGWAILHHYAGHNHPKGVQEILEYLKTAYGEKLSDAQRESIFDLINQRDNDGRSVLHLATLRHDTDIIRMILEFVHDMFGKYPKLIEKFYLEPDNLGWTPLHIATSDDDFKDTRLFLHQLQNVMTPDQFKKFINMQDAEGDTPYDYARPASRKLLRRYGAEITEISERQLR